MERQLLDAADCHRRYDENGALSTKQQYRNLKERELTLRHVQSETMRVERAGNVKE